MRIEKTVSEFDRHLHHVIGSSLATRRHYLRYVRQFLHKMAPNSAQHDSTSMKPADIIRFIEKEKDQHKIASLKVMLSALRSFFRFLRMRGWSGLDLAAAVPAVPNWKLSSIPRYLTKEQLQKLLAGFDRTTANGRRNYAIVICLARLGLRCQEVARLTMDDIDWRAGVLRIAAGKSRRVDAFPLPREVGRAIVAYLRNGRPTTRERHLFVCHHHTVGAPLGSVAVGSIVSRGFQRTGLAARGAHILRNTVATHMIQQGHSIKEVADFLRHRSIDTTAIYAKVNIPMLREAALPWPKEAE